MAIPTAGSSAAEQGVVQYVHRGTVELGNGDVQQAGEPSNTEGAVSLARAAIPPLIPATLIGVILEHAKVVAQQLGKRLQMTMASDN
jgi:hypothetical protein